MSPEVLVLMNSEVLTEQLINHLLILDQEGSVYSLALFRIQTVESELLIDRTVKW